MPRPACTSTGRRLSSAKANKIADACVGEDDPRAGMALAQLDGVTAERRDAPPGVHEHRQAIVIGESEHALEPRVGELELLRARVELDAARPRLERPRGLAERIGRRVEAREGDEAALRGSGE